jgi:hypothetical protein
MMPGAAGGGWLWQLAARWSRYGHAAQAAICPLLLAWVHGVDETGTLFARVVPLLCLCLVPVLVCWFGRVLGLGSSRFLPKIISLHFTPTTHNPRPTIHDSTYRPLACLGHHHPQHTLTNTPSARSYAPRLARAVAVPRPASHHAPGRIAIAQFPRRGH